MAAYVNLNDPDAEIWVTLYAFAAIIAFATALNMVHMLPAIPAIIPLFILTISGIWSYYLSQEIEYPSNLWEFFETEQGMDCIRFDDDCRKRNWRTCNAWLRNVTHRFNSIICFWKKWIK
jgi:hypothetical protein